METTSLAPAAAPVSAPPLRLLSLDDANIGLDDVIVRPRKPGVAFVAVFALGAAGLATWKATTGDLPLAIAAGCAAAFLGATWLLLRHRLRGRRPGAWQMAIGRDRVLIRYRGVVEADLSPNAPQLIELPLANVLGVRQLKRGIHEAGRDGQMLSYTYLDFRVRDCDLRPLQAVLQGEQSSHTRTWLTRRNPGVIVGAEGVLRVETSFQGTGTAPDTDEILRLLAERVPRDADAQEYLDLRQPTTLLPEDKEKGLRAIGEVSTHRALLLAELMHPQASRAELQQRIADLVACPAPAAPARPGASADSVDFAATSPLAESAATPELAASAETSGLSNAAPRTELARTPQPSASASASAPTSADGGRGEVALPSPRFLRPSEAAIRGDERLVRPNAVFQLVFGIVLLGVAGWMGWRYREGTIHWGWAAGVGAFCLLFGVWMLQSWRLSLRPEAWLLAIGPERVLVRVRTYLNAHLTADEPQIVELPLAHLVSVRLRNYKRERGGPSDGKNYKHTTYLDFRTRDTDLGPLGEALAREYAPRADGSSTPPIVLMDGDMLSVVMEPTRPDRDEVLCLLGERMPREDTVSEVVDLGGRSRMRLTEPPAPKHPPVRDT
ncbi:MAG TPA: hypothetical protein VE871_17810 [Longimicrobium sp.]|nr:hypothetical protein [Longimicrobium sp.]